MPTRVPTTLPTDEEGRAINAPLTVAGQEWQVTCVGMGNPHAIVFVDDVDALDLAGVGPLFESDAVFPAKTNTEFVQARAAAAGVACVCARARVPSEFPPPPPRIRTPPQMACRRSSAPPT